MIMLKYFSSICCNTLFVCISVCLFVYIYFLTYSLPPVYFDSANGSDNFCRTMYNASPIKSSIITSFQRNVFIHVAADIRTCKPPHSDRLLFGIASTVCNLIEVWSLIKKYRIKIQMAFNKMHFTYNSI